MQSELNSLFVKYKRDVPYYFALEVDKSYAALINIGNCKISIIINPTQTVKMFHNRVTI
jgi:hypothetical protein